jgi:hypothetical protein
MKNRLLFILLSSLLIVSFSLNVIGYEALDRAERNNKFDSRYYSEIVGMLHQRIIEDTHSECY